MQHYKTVIKFLSYCYCTDRHTHRADFSICTTKGAGKKEIFLYQYLQQMSFRGHQTDGCSCRLRQQLQTAIHTRVKQK